MIVPDLGAYPMRQNVTCADYEGTTISSLASTCHGIFLHELSHAFGLSHDFRNDVNCHGNDMGNGFRGVRGDLYPRMFPDDTTRLEYGSALSINVSRYFNPDRAYTDNTKPTVTVSPHGSVNTRTGQMEISFQASDAGGLACAILRWKFDVCDQMPLRGTSVNATFQTPYYTPNADNRYQVTVYDQSGNRRDVGTTVTVGAVTNRAPIAFIDARPPTIEVGRRVTLDASRSTDSDDDASRLTVQWDLDGDGTFDTTPTLTKVLVTRALPEGNDLVRARIADPKGGFSLSEPIAVNVTAPAVNAPRTGKYPALK